MTPQDQQLIEGLIERARPLAAPPPAYAPDPGYASGPAYAPQPAPPAWGVGGGGGGFLRGAAQTATGVAGGMLAAEAVQGLVHELGWGQHHRDGFFGGSIPPAGTAPEEVIVNNYYVEQPPADDTAQAG